MRYKINKQTKVSDQQLVSQLSGSIFSASRGRKGFIIAFFYTIFAFLTGVASYISRCFLRKRLGERTFGVLTILAVYVFIHLANLVSQIYPELLVQIEAASQDHQINTWLDWIAFGIVVEDIPSFGTLMIVASIDYINEFGVFTLTEDLKYLWYFIMALSAFHFIELYLSKRQGERYHSLYRGDSILFGFLEGRQFFGLKIKPLFIWMILEPLLIFLLAFIVKAAFNFNILSLILQISAVCLFIEEYRVYSENRQLVLDLIDSEMDSQYIVAVKEDIHQPNRTNDLQSGRVLIEA